MFQLVSAYLPIQESQKAIQSLDWEDSLEEEMATYSSVHAWEIPWTDEPTVYRVAKSRT